VVKQQPKKKKIKEPPKKQRRPVRAVIVRPPTLTNVAAKELDKRLTELYSVWHDFKPLEVGIDEAVWELLIQEEWGYSKRIMRKAFKLHVRDMRYREIVAKGGKRYNLSGEAVDDVHEFSMTYAQLHIDRKAARIIREEKLVEEIENAIAADRLKIQEAQSNRLSL
jgi:sRNA-binding protein